MPVFKHWRLESDEANIFTLLIDKSDSSANILSLDVINELEQVITSLKAHPCNGLFIYSAKENGFIAGADINSFTSLDTDNEITELIQKVQSIFNDLEKLSFPTVAVIKGFCLGGGLELALCCDYRIAIDDPKTRIGFPEILLGIHPGWGGSVRLMEKTGVLPAMKLILTGKTVDAAKALRLGIVDKCIPQHYAELAAWHLLANGKKPDKRNRNKFSRFTLYRKIIASILRKNVSSKVKQEHYPAPFSLINIWEKYGGDREQMLEEEGHSVARLLSTATAKNLIRVFQLQERLKAQGNKDKYPIDHVHVLGAGTMGGDIAAWCAFNGLTVTLQDREAKYISPAIKRAHQLFSRRLKKPHKVRAAMDRLIPDPRGQGIGHADLLIEAIIEDLEAKQALFQSIQHKLKPGAILASNTSSIPLDELAAGLDKPELLVGLHFFNPVAKMQLVEVVYHNNTNMALVQSSACFCRQINRLPLPVKSSPGFLINRILMPYLIEAVILLEEGEQPENIDQCAKDFGMPMGPLELSDAVGLDICLSVANILSHELDISVPKLLSEKVDAGSLGRKSGQGYYKYRMGKRISRKPGHTHISREDVTDRLILRMCSEAAKCWEEKIVSEKDFIDAGLIFGAGFAPFRGGPMHYLAIRGHTAIKNRLEELQSSYGERFKPGVEL
ncbi:MAG: crotonase [Gammaproteobacteria bacterium]|nr:crotonase [Gammaproteobacteria bacterium]NIN63099.1 crotonase [Gammaproteobacteria bacterium]NIO61537.1 crotonase [Gammaproteobacteria bacterium]NIQ10970.1 crotonase [Gammaproteobacteria bacterium]NIQ20716.1 crotonase [Gammaproteobacteria bacterium]